jgi:predicted O-methyltransferase YrrM
MEEKAVRDQAQLAEHFVAAMERFSGPGYYRALRWLHRILEPANYLEIGVDQGVSVEQALPATKVIGVDPAPRIGHDITPNATIYELTSDAFFAQLDVAEVIGGPIEYAFIDGLHRFEQVLRDFVNVERHAAGDAVVVLHDCLPLDAVTSARERTTDFYAGDVWKATLALRRRRRDLDMAIVPTGPTGLCLVRNLDSSNRELEEQLPEIEAEYLDLDFDYYLAHREEMPPEVDNDKNAVREWVARGQEPG